LGSLKTKKAKAELCISLKHKGNYFFKLFSYKTIKTFWGHIHKNLEEDKGV
jgi:hypothetical protein